MALADRGSAVDRRHHAVARELRWIGAEPHRAAEIAPRLALLEARFGHPFGDKADHGFVGRAKFGRRRLLDSRQVPYALDARHLHAEADAEIGHAVFAREADAGDLAFRPARSERAGHEDRVARFELRGDVAVAGLEQFGVDPADVDLHAIGDAAVDERFVERFIGILKADIFADDADRDLALGTLQPLDDLGPARQIGRAAGRDPERLQHLAVR